ncbi:hypothetical protein B566_EDAN013128 [Ephemera danica]|nr:hypothetical protein B566_EDAN013128 [Ephemera danica]
MSLAYSITKLVIYKRNEKALEMGSDQQFCLRWNNFQHSLLTSLPQLLDADDLTDVTLCAGGKSVKAHREMQPFYHPVIVLPQTSYPDVCALVSFMYSGEAGKISPPETPPSSKEEAAPPSKRPKLLTSTPNTNSNSSPTDVVSARLGIQRSLERLTMPKLETPQKGDLCDTTGAHTTDRHSGHSTSEDSHGSEPDLPEKLLHAVSHHHGLSPNLNPLNFLPAFSPFTSLARNKLFATCHICGKSLSNQYNLRVHLETHQNLNYSCNLCSHVSRSRDALRKHIAYKHTEGKDKFLPRKQNSSSTNSSPEEKLSNSSDKEMQNNNYSQQTSC